MTPDLAGTEKTPSKTERWRALLAVFVRRLQIGFVMAAVIAALLSLALERNYLITLVYSLCVTYACWWLIDGGRRLLARWVWRRQPDHPAARAQWPGWGWMFLWIAVAGPLGYELGIALGNLLTGYEQRALGLVATNPRAAAIILVVTLIASTGFTLWLFARARLAESETRAESAQRVATENQLKLLESQLEPHMLFNTLANLRVLIGIDPPRAQVMLDHLIAFLRATLNASRAGVHPLAAEFERVDDYLALLALRMGPRLTVQLDLPAGLRDVSVPPLLLQPLVENAIKHGLEPSVAGGRIEVVARAEGDRLRLSVRDTGVGMAAAIGTAPTSGTRFGLAQVRERLAAVYGARAMFSIAPAGDAEGGTVAEITLPLLPHEATAHEQETK
ncbi:MAG TPA: histidine kinase [Burkholderiaceae bacterium]|nr:histidine kinase [Burkholderiaceae bacterium]